MLAGISVDYYTRLERGNTTGASASVLEAFARTLQLDEAERAHLFDLVRAASAGGTARAPRRPAGQHVRPSVQRILDSMTTTPAYVRNGRLDILAANRRGTRPPSAARVRQGHQDCPGPAAACRRPGHRPSDRISYARPGPGQHPRRPDGPACGHAPSAAARAAGQRDDYQAASSYAQTAR